MNLCNSTPKILDEVADAQIQMCDSLEASLSMSLEHFAGIELDETNRLRNEAESIADGAESSFAKYLHGKNAHSVSETVSIGGENVNMAGGGSAVSTGWNKLSEGVGSQLGFSKWGRTNNINPTNDFDSSNSSMGQIGYDKNKSSRRGKNSNTDKEQFERAIGAANLRQNLEEIRLAQANAELKRFQLLRRLDSLKVRFYIMNESSAHPHFIFKFFSLNSLDCFHFHSTKDSAQF